MSSAFLSGANYEARIARRLTSLYWAKNAAPVRLVQPPAGATHGNDIQIIAPDGCEPSIINIEVKTASAIEAGQRTMKLSECRTRLVLPKGPHNDLHRYCLPAGFQPFRGRIPSFVLGHRSYRLWRSEKRHFRSEYIAIEDADIISRYYKNKGCHYIQLESLGLFHTGENPCEFDVPLFTCRTRLRIRCKQHGSSSLPSSVTCALEICDKNRLAPSPYCLEHRLPPGLSDTPPPPPATSPTSPTPTSGSSSGLFYSDSDSDSDLSAVIAAKFGQPGKKQTEDCEVSSRLPKASEE